MTDTNATQATQTNTTESNNTPDDFFSGRSDIDFAPEHDTETGGDNAAEMLHELTANDGELPKDEQDKVEAKFVKEEKETSEKDETKEKKETPKKEVKEEKKPELIKIKYDGNEEDFDISNHKETAKWVQLGKVSNKRFEEAASQKAATTQMLEAMQNHPIEVMKQLGFTEEKLNELFTNHLYQTIELQSMTPRERELFEAKTKLEQELTAKHLAEEQAKAGTQKERFQKTSQEIETMVIKGLDSRKDIPKNAFTAGRALYYMHQAVERDLPIDPEDVLNAVKNDYLMEQTSLYNDLDGDELIDLFGEKLAKKINKALVNKVKKNTSKIQQTNVKPTTRKGDEFYTSKEDFFNSLG